jgi:hypothetical protein
MPHKNIKGTKQQAARDWWSTGGTPKAGWEVCYNRSERTFSPRRIKEFMTKIDLGIAAPPVSPITFYDWDHRPAVLIGGKAYAVLGPRDPWCMVDSLDVAHTACVKSEAAWRKEFEGAFGSLDLSLIAGARRENIQFVNWGQRPAAVVRGNAFAVSSAPPWMWKAVDPSPVTCRGVYMAERAWRRMFMGKFGRLALFRQENRPTDKEFDDAARRLYAADLESKPTKYGFPGVMALVLSRTLQQVAKDIGDGQMMLYATDMERRARGVTELYLSFQNPNETAN